MAVLAVHGHGLDGTRFRIGPVDPSGHRVQRDARRPVDAGIHQDFTVTAVKTGHFNFRVHSPIGPEHLSRFGIDGDVVRLIQQRSKQSDSLRAVQSDRRDRVVAGIHPVNSFGQPIDGHASGIVQSGNEDFGVLSFYPPRTVRRARIHAVFHYVLHDVFRLVVRPEDDRLTGVIVDVNRVDFVGLGVRILQNVVLHGRRLVRIEPSKFTVAGDHQISSSSLSLARFSFPEGPHRVSCGTGTRDVARLLLDANLRTLSELARMFLAVLLVGEITTVVGFVADELMRDAMSTVTSKLRFVTHAAEGRALSIVLVRMILAVLDAVAHLGLWNAGSITASELIRSTGQRTADGRILIRIVVAIHVAIANPQIGNALAVVTRVFALLARQSAALLIAAVSTVRVSVAMPLAVDAELGTVTLKFVWLTRRRTILFVALVLAVKLSVTLPRASNATSVLASELALGTVPRFASDLIRVVAAVVVEIAVPPTGNAPIVVTLEVGRIAGVILLIAARRRFILATGAVVIAVALPRQRNASTRIASQLIGRTRSFLTVGRLVRFIAAVVIVVAHPHVRNALAAGASELIRWTSARRTVAFVLFIRTVDLSVATARSRNTSSR